MTHARIGFVFGAFIVALWSWPAAGQVTTEHPASILVFPKVIADGTRDTIVQISNISNSLAYAHCWYLDGRTPNPSQPAGPTNEPLWSLTDFSLTLTRQQPTSWVASQGRLVSADPSCTSANFDCSGAGIDPGVVPGLPVGFRGELRCVEVDSSGTPVSGNQLVGEATLENAAGGEVAKYTALGFEGLDGNDGDPVLNLGTEYTGCPARWILAHHAEGAEVGELGPGSSTHTEVTIVPCTMDLDTQCAETVSVSLAVTNELEMHFSTSTSVTCWDTFALSDFGTVFDLAAVGTPAVQTSLSPAQDSGGFLLVAEEIDSAATARSRTGIKPCAEGNRSTSDTMTLPAM